MKIRNQGGFCVSVVVPEPPEEQVNDCVDIIPPMIFREWLRKTSPIDLYNQLCSHVYSQDAEMKKAAVMLHGFITAMARSNFDTRFSLLIEGSSGSGKTSFAKALKKIMPCPVVVADASSLSPSGYKGMNISDVFSASTSDKGDLAAWSHCFILVLDELDKLLKPAVSSDGNFHLECINNLLKVLDGDSIITKDGEVSCEKVFVIGLGAFSDLRKPVEADKCRSIGFCAETASTAHKEPPAPISKEILTKYCQSEQFIGRFPVILHFQKLGRSAYEKLVEKEISELRSIYGYFSFPYERIRAIVNKAMTTEFGGRSIKAEVWNWFLESDFVFRQAEPEIIKGDEVDKVLEGMIPPHLKRMVSA